MSWLKKEEPQPESPALPAFCDKCGRNIQPNEECSDAELEIRKGDTVLKFVAICFCKECSLAMTRRIFGET